MNQAGSGGLSRSNRNYSLTTTSSPSSSPSSSPTQTSGTDSPSPPLSQFTSPSSHGMDADKLSNEGLGAGVGSSKDRNVGFIITSRMKHYTPPDLTSRPRASTSTSLPSGSPPTPPSPISHTGPTSLSHNPSGSSSFRSRRSSPPAPFRLQYPISRQPSSEGGNNGNVEPKTTLTLSSSVDSKGRRMVNQYVRLKTIGQGSHGKVWLCAEPTVRESDEDALEDSATPTEGQHRRERKGSRHGKEVATAHSWEEELDGDVKYCAIKSVAREGPGRGKSLRMAKGRKAEGGGIGADDKVKREVAIMKRLDHKNVVRLKEVIDDVKSKKVFMVLEFMAGGQIEWQDQNKNPTMTVDEARRTFRDVVLGLEYLHYQGVIHRDIKPANLLWTEDHSVVKISDFGVSHVSEALLRASPGGGATEDDKALRKTAGSPAFFAPELCHSADYTAGTPSSVTTPRREDGGNYFSAENGSTAGIFSSGRSTHSGYSSPSTPNAARLATHVISHPLLSPSSLKPRSRPVIGKGIDVWALGVTLYCLLFGDTPFMARTEYELYDIIVTQSVRIPERMGREGAWTGVGRGWANCGDGKEGMEVVDLLRRLLEKDPAKRIGLDEVKKHPWVLRNLSSSPDSWLDETDPAHSDPVINVTEEDVQHATLERGAVDAVPQIRNRPGIRRALNAALVRFPAFSRLGTSSPGQEAEGRSRSKSASSTSQSIGSETPSRHPSDAAARSRNSKTSSDFAAMDLRRIISGKDRDMSPSRTASPGSPSSSRGRWGGRSSRQASNEVPPPLPSKRPDLPRSASTSSLQHANALPRHLLADRHARTNPSSPAPSSLSAPSSDSESSHRKTFGNFFSKLSGKSKGNKAEQSPAAVSDDGSGSYTSSLTPVEDLSGERHQYNSRVSAAELSTSPTHTRPAFDLAYTGHRREETVDLSEFDYSSDEEDELDEPPLRQADTISGWQSDFSSFKLGQLGHTSPGEHNPIHPDHGVRSSHDVFKRNDFAPSNSFDQKSTPRVSTDLKGINVGSHEVPPPLVRGYSDSPSRRSSKSVSNSLRDGSIRHGISGEVKRSLHNKSEEEIQEERRQYSDGEEEEDETEIFVAPRRRRIVS